MFDTSLGSSRFESGEICIILQHPVAPNSFLSLIDTVEGLIALASSPELARILIPLRRRARLLAKIESSSAYNHSALNRRSKQTPISEFERRSS
jgi:hypothetical protein